MLKRYDKLADHLVNIDNAFSSKEEAIALMKVRTKKIILSSPKQQVA
jgi:ribosomal protein S8